MDERTPLLRRSESSSIAPPPLPNSLGDPHTDFCILAGIPPSNLPKDAKWPKASRTSIYQRAKSKESAQNRTYIFTAALTNSLLLSQIVIGAALTALGASQSPSIYVTIFGALNTVIAGLVTYLKSRGQPMRARMFRDDLERVVDQIENSETMWLGIARNMHGYDEIDIDDEVSVRSEVARLTRLYDKAVRNNTFNNPDLYLNQGVGAEGSAALRARPEAAAPAPAAAAPAGTIAAPTPAPAPAADPDESPATKTKTPDPAPAPAPAPAPVTPASPPKEDKPAEPPLPPSDKPSDKPSDEPADKPTETSSDKSEAKPADGSATAPAASAPGSAPAVTPAPASTPSTPQPLAADIDEGPVTMLAVKKGDSSKKNGSDDDL